MPNAPEAAARGPMDLLSTNPAPDAALNDRSESSRAGVAEGVVFERAGALRADKSR